MVFLAVTEIVCIILLSCFIVYQKKVIRQLTIRADFWFALRPHTGNKEGEGYDTD